VAIAGNLDYALARVAARQGQRVDDAAWRRLEASRDLDHYVAAVRSTALARWVSAMAADHDCHTMERSLREQWRRYVEEVAGWHPRAWQAWLAWPAWLPALSLLAQLARPALTPQWLLADPVLGPIGVGTPSDRAAALARTRLAPLAPAVAGRTSPGAAWCTQWQVLQPRSDIRTQHCLLMLRRTMEQHARALQLASDSAEVLRTELANRLQRLFRAAADTVIASVCHLALVGVDLERLRGGLACRRLFGDDRAEHR
jgi:hypothetical protein